MRSLQHQWRARAEYQGAVGSWAARQSFVAPANDGYIRGSELYDPLINGKTVFPFAAELEAREIPFLFATAYGSRGIPEEFRGHLVLQKPFGPVELRRALMELSGVSSH